MILVNSDWSRVIDFENFKVNTIVVENVEYFRRVVSNFIGQVDGAEGKFSLSHENKGLDLSKNALLISDIFDVNPSLKKANGKINKYIKTLSIDSFEATRNITSDLEKYIDELLTDIDLPIVRSETIDIDDILKISNIHVEQGEDIIENLVNIFNVCTALLDIRLFVFINIHKLMTSYEWDCFIKTVILKDANILIFESEVPRDFYIDNGIEKIYIIDEELCEI